MNLLTLLIVAGVVFIAELPDKSMIAALILSTRFAKRYVWIGTALAFLVHVIIAVLAGHFLTLLPQRYVDFTVAALFLIGALLLVFERDEAHGTTPLHQRPKAKRTPSAFGVIGTSFMVVFLGEWGDITQILVANYAAKYHDALSVGIGAVIGLWAVSGLGIVLGSKLLDRVPARLLKRITALILFGFAVSSIVAGFRAA